MSLPPRCFTCGKLLKNWDVVFKKDSDLGTSLDKLGYKKRCCRRMYFGYIPEIEEKLLKYDSKYRGGDGRTS